MRQKKEHVSCTFIRRPTHFPLATGPQFNHRPSFHRHFSHMPPSLSYTAVATATASAGIVAKSLFFIVISSLFLLAIFQLTLFCIINQNGLKNNSLFRPNLYLY